MGRMCVWGVVVFSTFLVSSSPILASDIVSPGAKQHEGSTQLPMISSQIINPPSYRHVYNNCSKRRYQYFPSVRVYHDADRGLYFFPQGLEWRIAVSLPGELRMQLEEYVTIEMESSKPYIYNEQHQKKYPSGQVKKATKEKSNI